MKTKIRLQPLAFSFWPFTFTALLFAVSPQNNSPADAAQLLLSGECSSNNLILRWTGDSGIKLQQNTNFTNPIWQDVPGSDGVSSVQLPMTNPMAAFRLLDAGSDGDGDFLDDWFETNGWTIFIDTSGYGSTKLVSMNVTSDPRLADTDGDGLDDFWEWIIGTNPRATDTDGDGLSDYAEWFQWYTSPTSVDTDGDARGPKYSLPPKAQLFDGNELSLLHTSPTLEDTDGDGRTDYEEYDQLGRSPLVAQLPNLRVEMVDAVDIRLDVQYAEALGQTHQYGAVITEGTTTTERNVWSHGVQTSLKLGGKSKAGFFDTGVEASTEFTIGWSGSYTFDKATATTSQKAITDYTTDSRTRTETAATGSMLGSIRLVNTGPVTYTLKNFGVTARYWWPQTNGSSSFRTLGTLVPTLGNGIVLAPGDSTPVLQVQATGINASRVKEFMTRPSGLILEQAFYELENAQGLNFDYLEEVTRWRTAGVEIDYGNGTNEQYRVATNVERNEDGTYAGVTMGFVMSNLLHVPFQTTNILTLIPTNATNERVLYKVRNVVTTSATNGFWIVAWSGDRTQVRTNFEDIVLQAGEAILLSFIRDDDGDGLFAPEEQHYGTDDTGTVADDSADSDGDGLFDVFEARTGWDVVVLNRTNHVFSDARAADQDGDGLTDSQEFNNGVNSTDPTRPDTDEDGLADGVDPHPTVSAKVLRVKWDAVPGGTNGATWATALTNLQAALTLARNGLATTGDPADDVAEIWVAAGAYKPTTTTTNRTARFELVNKTALYGGFTGVETKLSQRNFNPLFNGTVLSGDLLNNDTSAYQENPTTFGENSYNVCYAAAAVGTSAVLDGFTITGGNDNSSSGRGGGVLSSGHLQLKNLLFRANHAESFGGAIYGPSSSGGSLLISDCLFLQNSVGSVGQGVGNYSGGGIYAGVPLSLTNCLFIQNEAANGGAIYGTGALSIEDCEFTLNLARDFAGAIFQANRPARISRSRFLWNTATSNGGGLNVTAQNSNQTIEVLQCVFVGNAATLGSGGAVYTFTVNGYTTSLQILNSTFAQNTSKYGGGVFCVDLGATTWMENSILWGNTPTNFVVTTGSQGRVRTSCLPEAAKYPAAGNINADPKFVNAAAGDVRLQSSSPCIDAGNNYVDYYPSVPGFQPLPAADLDGNPRIVNGTVDMGAYEYQGP